MPIPHERVKTLFLAALERPVAERRSYVERVSGGDAELQSAVIELLGFHDEDEDAARGGFGALVGAVAREVGGDALEESFGAWRALRLLGRGGMGVVMLAEHAPDGTLGAVKRIAAGLDSPELVRRFEREIEVLGRLQHPGIARLLDHGTSARPGGPQPYLVLEYVEGEPLRLAMAARSDLRARVELLARIAESAAHAHGRGVVHRDLKPDNVIVRRDGTPVLVDFGVAAIRELEHVGRSDLTRTGLLLGTPQYMSPEQVIGTPDAIGPPSDVYSLGMMAYEFLASRPPYDARQVSLHRAMVLILTAEPPRPSALAPELRGDLEHVLARALEKRPEDRYADAGELAADLRAWLDRRHVSARPTMFRRVARAFRRRRRRVLGAAVTLGAAVVLAVAARPALEQVASRQLAALCADAWSAHMDLHAENRRPETVAPARTALERLQREIRGEDAPWSNVLRRWTNFRLAECELVLNEFDRDPERLRRAVVLLRQSREEFEGGGDAPVPVGPRSFRSAVEADPRLWNVDHLLGAVYESLAEVERPASHIERALACQRATREALLADLGVKPPGPDPESTTEMLGWRNGIGRMLVERGALLDSVRAIQDGLAMVRAVQAVGGIPGDGMFQGSVAQSLGLAHLRLAELEPEPARFDSARDAFRMAMAIRSPERPLHYTESSLGLVEASVAQAEATADPVLRRTLLERAGARIAMLRSQVAARSMRRLAADVDEREAEVLALRVLAGVPGSARDLPRADTLLREAARPGRTRPGPVPAAWREYRAALLAAAMRQVAAAESSRHRAQERAREHLELAAGYLAPEQDLRFARKLRGGWRLAGLGVPEDLASVHPARP